MPSRVDQLIMEMRARDKNLTRQLRSIQKDLQKTGRAATRAGTQTDRAGKKAEGMGKRMKAAGGAVKFLLGTMLALSARAAVGIFVGFSREMNNVRAITNATDKEFQQLIGTAEELGATTQFTAREAAQAMTFLARTGLDTNQVIGAMPATLNLAAATAVDLGTAADISTNIMKAMGLEVEDLSRVVDVLAKTTNSANTDLIQLGEGMKYVAPVAANANMSLAETASILGKLGDAGIQSSLAGVALRRSIINLTTGSGAAGAAIKRLGLTTRDSEGNFVGLTNILEQLGEQSVSDADLVDLFGARALAAAQVLLNTGAPAIRAFTEEIEAAGGTAERMAAQQMAGLPGVSLRVKSAVEALAITFGRAMEPALMVTGEAIIWLTKQFRYALGGFQALGVATGVIWEGIVTGVEMVRDVVALVLSGIIGEIGWVVEKAGWLASKLGLDIGEGVEGAGTAMRDFADRAMRGALDDIGAQGREFGLIWKNAGNQLEEIADAATGLGDAADDAADAVGRVNQALDDSDGDRDQDDLEAREKLMEELAQRFSAVALTAAERQAGAIRILREQLEKELGTLPDYVEAQLELMMSKAEEALNRERAKALAKGFRDALNEELQGIELEGLGAQTDEERLQLLERQREIVQRSLDAVLERLRATELTKQEEEELTKLAIEFGDALRDATGEVDQLTGSLKQSGDELLKNLQSTLTLIRQATDGLLEMGQAFGLINSESADTIRNLVQIGEGAATAGAGIASGNVGGVIAGGLQMIGGIAGLFGGGPSAQELAVEENTVALFLLADEMDKLAARLQDQKDELSQLSATLKAARVVEKRSGFLGLGSTRGIELSPGQIRSMYRAAQALGLTFPEELLEEAAKARAGERIFVEEDLARQFSGLLDDVLNEQVKQSAGETQDVIRSVSITELQANQLLAYQASQLYIQEAILAALTGGLIGAPQIVPGGGGGGGFVTLQVGPNEIYLGEGGSRQEAEQFVDEVLRIAGDRLTDQQRLVGA